MPPMTFREFRDYMARTEPLRRDQKKLELSEQEARENAYYDRLGELVEEHPIFNPTRNR